MRWINSSSGTDHFRRIDRYAQDLKAQSGSMRKFETREEKFFAYCTTVSELKG